ncbi:MAG TPA: Ig-like domain-containing protein [Pseudonocardiaceae bacterium]
MSEPTGGVIMLGDQRRWRSVVALLGVVALGLLPAGCAGSLTAENAPSAGATQSTRAPAPAKVEIEPQDGAQDVSPIGPIRVSVTDGTLTEITLTNPDGKQVNGTLSPDKRTWTVTEPLGYDRTYTWSGTAVGTDGKPVQVSGSFRTLKPARKVAATLNVADNATVGIAMPIQIVFNSAVKDRAAVERAVRVESDPPTEGAWGWLDDTHLVWRPREYWKPGTSVRVDARLYGVPHGGGAYGSHDLTSSFTIGRAQIVKANTATHRMVVIRDGQQIADYPASYGLETDPNRVTRNGTYWVMSKHATYSMTNERYGYRDVVVPWALRLSNNGEFIHGYAPSVWAQGKQNVSHGCVNLSPENAKKYFDSALIGDPVEVEGSPIDLPTNGNDIWAIPWDVWRSKSAA